MSLVSYDSSDDDSQEYNESNTESISRKESDEKVDPSAVVSLSSREESTSNLFGRLPPPKTTSNQTINQNSSLNDIIVDKSSSGSVKIFVPSFRNYSEESEDKEEDDIKSKRFKGSISGTGLSSILPKPKNSNTTKSCSLIPQSLLRPKPNSSAIKRPQNVLKNKREDQLSDQKVNYFFENEEKIEEISLKEMPLSNVEYGPKPESTTDSNTETSNSRAIGSSITQSINDITYKKFIASKFGEEAPEDIDIVDIDVSKHLSESKDWLKTISEEKEEEYSGVQPSSTAKRKHQITYLALQAKQREVELKNEWARNRTTKTMSRAKYGF